MVSFRPLSRVKLLIDGGRFTPLINHLLNGMILQGLKKCRANNLRVTKTAHVISKNNQKSRLQDFEWGLCVHISKTSLKKTS